MSKFEENFKRLSDASFPILYVDTLEDNKATAEVYEICQKIDRGVIEWSLTGGKDFTIGGNLSEMNLAETLKFLFSEENYLDNKIILLKDTHFLLMSPLLFQI